jgi:hypothetical protein
MWIIDTALGLVKEGLAFLNKKQDVALEKYKVDGQVNVSAMVQDTEIIKARAALAAALKDDPVVRWGRRFFIYPIGVWFTLICYDSAFRRLLPAGWTWEVLALPQNLNYIPYAVVAFLFVSAWKK